MTASLIIVFIYATPDSKQVLKILRLHPYSKRNTFVTPKTRFIP